MPVKRAALIPLALAVFATLPAAGGQAKTTAEQMLMLDPAARVEQRCNSRGMGEIEREHKSLHPDELVAYAYANTKLNKQHLVASGAAVRSGSTWYHMSYSCETAHDGMDIKSFSYQLGEAIPRSEWEAHYLVAP
ncbi:DUF930 domain-containing protein [Ancylobacter defluvii]|uniref:DUF930 domain-containing protein n=1 Tax=Ancylobacter defluvii TaxID=1282440 RepID=A0A9W6JV39_9HYPH|nr:DUF930 domain-containing protein [Ancylobacter defluvii]GLK81998.1 hypothetical protein GCM10017653_00670 [Ancylobacter defluvii]